MEVRIKYLEQCSVQHYRKLVRFIFRKNNSFQSLLSCSNQVTFLFQGNTTPVASFFCWPFISLFLCPDITLELFRYQAVNPKHFVGFFSYFKYSFSSFACVAKSILFINNVYSLILLKMTEKIMNLAEFWLYISAIPLFKIVLKSQKYL